MAADLINGEIPDHWEFTTLGEICQRGGGNIQTGPFGSQLHASDYVTVGVPSIMPTNIGDNRIVEDGIVRITEEDANRLRQHRLRAGDILFTVAVGTLRSGRSSDTAKKVGYVELAA